MYYNLPASHADVEPEDELPGLPMEELDYWTKEYAAFTRFDASIDWGAYRVEVEGRVGDNACFAETLYPLPGAQLTTPIDRVFVDGLPPAGCEDCQSDADCPSLFGNCVEGICTSN